MGNKLNVEFGRMGRERWEEGKGGSASLLSFPSTSFPAYYSFSLSPDLGSIILYSQSSTKEASAEERESYEPRLYVSVNLLAGVWPPSYDSITVAIFIVHTCP